MATGSISEQEVREQLELILGDASFHASSRLKNFFRFIVEETLAGNAGQLKAYTIATTVFGRGKNFDSLYDPVVRVETAKLRNRLMEYYFSASSPGAIRIEVPKGGYVPAFSRHDVREPSNSLAKKEDNSAQNLGPESEHKLEYAAPEATSTHALEPPLHSSFSDSSSSSTQSSSQISEKARKTAPYAQISLALLPFINLSPSNADDNFISGLTDEITLALTRFEDMSIVSSYSTRNLNPAQENIYSLAEKLGVRFMLHGSVQCNNNIVRVRVELADAHTGSNIWAERFDAKVDNKEMFSIQEEIAQCLVSRIGDSFGSIRRKLMHEVSTRQSNGLELYETLLSYHHWMPTFDPNLFKEAKQALEKTLEQDPNDPVVVAALADLYASDYQLGYNTVPDALNKAQEFALRAIAMDGTSQTAYWALALVFFLRRNRSQFEKTIKQVVPLNPANSYMLVATGLLIGLADNVEGGLALMERAMELNPASPSWILIVSYWQHYKSGNFEAALNDALLVNTPDCFWDPMLRAAVYGQLGYGDEAEKAVAELLAIQPDFVQNYKRYVHALAFSDKSAAELEDGLKKAGLRLK